VYADEAVASPDESGSDAAVEYSPASVDENSEGSPAASSVARENDDAVDDAFDHSLAEDVDEDDEDEDGESDVIPLDALDDVDATSSPGGIEGAPPALERFDCERSVDWFVDSLLRPSGAIISRCSHCSTCARTDRI
jgi:hypothetical protein